MRRQLCVGTRSGRLMTLFAPQWVVLRDGDPAHPALRATGVWSLSLWQRWRGRNGWFWATRWTMTGRS